MSDSPIKDANLVKQARPLLWSPAMDQMLEEAFSPPVTSPADKAASPDRSRPRAVSPPALSLVSTEQLAVDPVQPAPPAQSSPDRYSPTIKQLPVDERPRERLYSYGASALSTAELIGILIRVGNGERSAVSLGEHLLAHFGNIGEVAAATVEQLAQVKGIGKAKAAQIKAAIEMGKRVAVFASDARPTVNSPDDIANLVMPDLRFLKKETLKSILLDAKNGVIAVKLVSIGDLSTSIVHPREVFKDAIIASAASIVVAHNHPSGDPTPSQDDINVTKRLFLAGEVIGIDFLDHIIVGDGRWVSMKEKGLI